MTGALSEDSRSKLDGIVAKMQSNGESDQYIQGVVNDFKGKYGGMGVNTAPTWNDDFKARMSTLDSEVSGVASVVPAAIHQIMGGHADTENPYADKHLIEPIKKMWTQLQNNDMDGLAHSIGSLAGSVVLGKVAANPESLASGVSSATQAAAGLVQKAGNAVGSTVQAAASSPVGQVLGKAGLKAVVGHVPVVGPFIRTGMDLYDASKKVSADVSSQVKVSPKISVAGVSDSMGTTPATATPNTPGAVTSTLDAATQTKLAKAAQSEEINALPAQTKADLVQAVRNGDSGTVNDILNGKAKSVEIHKQDTINKIAVLARYAKDYNIDLDAVASMGEADRQFIADAAVAHAGKVGGLTVPRSGRYRSISDSTWQLVRDSLR